MKKDMFGAVADAQKNKMAVKMELNTAEDTVKATKHEVVKYNTEPKVAYNISIPASYKKRLQKYAYKKQLSPSVLIQMWIDEKIDEKFADDDV